MKKDSGIVKFTQLLMLWHKKYNKRQMPWKGEKDPYKIWLSEVILQQTRVEQGLDYYLKFLKAYPTVKKLAEASDNDVYKLWEGLGYYSRCKNLLSAARTIAGEKKGKFPNTYQSILELKGVGPYTAAAIASFAFDLPYAVVDGNVNRVLSRFFNIDFAIDSTKGKLFFNELAFEALDKGASALYNQAIMDFGATVCKPQLPLCSDCFLQKNCLALKNGSVNVLPVKEKKIVKKHRWFYYIVAEYGNKILVKKRLNKDIWHNLHEFILLETESYLSPEQIDQTLAFKELENLKYKIIRISDSFKQQLTHQTVHAVFIHIKMSRKIIPEGMEFADKEDLLKLAFPRLINGYMEQEFWSKQF